MYLLKFFFCIQFFYYFHYFFVFKRPLYFSISHFLFFFYVCACARPDLRNYSSSSLNFLSFSLNSPMERISLLNRECNGLGFVEYLLEDKIREREKARYSCYSRERMKYNKQKQEIQCFSMFMFFLSIFF